MKKAKYLIVLLLGVIVTFSACNKDENADNSFNLFTVQDDIDLGKGVKAEIAANPANYPVMSPSQYPDAYYHIERIRDSVLSSGLITYEDTFDWEVKIIKNDTMLNAFAVPGGYMYFYTGLIYFLENEAQFAGVMAHEMAHVDRRHSTDQLTKAYGLQILLAVVLGNNPSVLAELVAGLSAGLSQLAFSRTAEYEADEFAVKYLYETSYDARGIGDFFVMMEGSPHPPEFLSTHPSPENRIESINEVWTNLGGKEGNTYEASYQEFKNSLSGKAY